MDTLKPKEIVFINVTDIKENDSNPRYITKEDFADLVDSIKNFPQMLQVKPIIIDENYIILGGNMRIKALKKAGIKIAPVLIIDDWNDEQKKEFIIKDNVHSGRWDTDILVNEWDTQNLLTWGLDLFTPDNKDYFDTDPIEEEESTKKTGKSIVLSYTEAEYTKTIKQLAKISSTPEEAIRILLKRKEN